MSRNTLFKLALGLLAGAATAAACAADAAAPAASAASAVAAPRAVFSWPADAGIPKTRGGSDTGALVTLERAPSAQWQALQAPGLSPQERDRRAILAMAGEYRITFEFQEIATFTAAGKPAAPYRTWGTEKVYVDIDKPGFVSLLHILEMHGVDDDGALTEPVVVKHWRQEWTYQPTVIVEYEGAQTWQRRTVPAADRRGAWSQTVTQVDESPRYAGLGRWQHTPGFSTWISNEVWRPLPRREWTVRKDYQVLLGTNRHTIVPTGWVQEENNLKGVVAGPHKLDAAQPYLAREYGVARYERIREADFKLADDYHERTRPFWDRVRQDWSIAFTTHGTVKLRGQVDVLGLYKPLFERADEIAGKPQTVDAKADAALIGGILADMGVPR
jgi:hypothetical protein